MCIFDLPKPAQRNFSIVVTYRQPTVGGLFYYVPLFEEGKTPRDAGKFSFTAFPSEGGRKVSLLSKHAAVRERTDTRIALFPEHEKLISIRLEDAKPDR
jgi:hypothetical protein